VGPQLEGVGGRSLERLIEDVLWPDRNVDEAFRTSTWLLEDGEVISGLVRQRTVRVLVMADQEGRERGIPIESIVQEKLGQRSLMPGNYDELLGDQELADLLGYLRRTARRPNQ
jgi:putative heme-binding domain-containing protein